MSDQPTTIRANDVTSPYAAFSQGGMVVVPWEVTMVKGSGYDSISRTVFSTAAPNDGASLKAEPALGHTSQTVRTRVRRVENLQQLSDYLLVQANANLKYDLFSGSTIGQFVKESTVNAYSLYFLVECYVLNSAIQIKGFSIDPKKKDLGPSKFRANFGDYFVAGWIEGGYLIGLAEISVNSRKALTELNTALSAAYKSGVEFDGKFLSSWQQALSETGVSESLSVLYAGLDDASLQMNATPVGSGEPGRIVSAQPPREEDYVELPPDADGVKVEYVELDEDEEVIELPDDDEAGIKVMVPKSFLKLLQANPRLDIPGVADHANIKLTMEGLLKLAAVLPQQAKQNGIPLYAVLQPYRTLNDAPDTVDSIDKQALNVRRDRLSRIFLRAREIQNSVVYALASLRGGSQQFEKDETTLKQIDRDMTELIRKVGEAWGTLNMNPATKADSELQEPDLALIPRRLWGGEKIAFLAPAPLVPESFIQSLQAVTRPAKAIADSALRDAVIGYLQFAIEQSANNYVRVATFVKILAAEIENMDTRAGKRETTLSGLAGQIGIALNEWIKTTELVRKRYEQLSALASANPKQISFLTEIDAILREPNEPKYGFQGFWQKLKSQLEELSKQEKTWSKDDKTSDLVSFGLPSWKIIPEQFQTARTTLNTEVKQQLL
ncbi:MAG: hypothetical protein KME21_31090 [Desmonostoc vinosum HA7617-LM4]|jgi:hypothetical protein|nr:hypothetical protein [Desmonostoc vinosum HA7617-LM4]